jgi:hypothetical protein
VPLEGVALRAAFPDEAWAGGLAAPLEGVAFNAAFPVDAAVAVPLEGVAFAAALPVDPAGSARADVSGAEIKRKERRREFFMIYPRTEVIVHIHVAERVPRTAGSSRFNPNAL